MGDTDQLSRSGLKRELQVGPEEAETAIPGKVCGEPWARKWELVPIPRLPLDLCVDLKVPAISWSQPPHLTLGS